MTTPQSNLPPQETRYLSRTQLAQTAGQGLVAISIAHNEGHILPGYLEHYRARGVAHFILIDDHSTDATASVLEGQPDVTIYKPKPGSTFGVHKSPWRCDVLDAFCDGAWAMLPDVDEHIVYPSMEERPLSDLVAHIEAEGAEVMIAIMVDMFRDAPLGEQPYDGGSLIEAYPLFDDPTDPVDGYRLLPAATRFQRKYPTPPICAYGGVRERMFYRSGRKLARWQRTLLEKYAHIGRPLDPKGWDWWTYRITRRAVKRWLGTDPFQMTKIALVKWRTGMRVPGGPHALTQSLKLSETSAAYLHFKFVGGADRFQYNSDRGQHAAGGAYYQQIMDAEQALSELPTRDSTRRYSSSRDFEDLGLIRRGTWR